MGLSVEVHNMGVPEVPEFDEPRSAAYAPDLDRIQEKADAHTIEHLVVVGNGGSVTSFRAYRDAFQDDLDVDADIVTTMDPDRMHAVAERSDPASTLVIPISKSGETAGVLEATLFLRDHGLPLFPVTSDDGGALRELVRREGLDWLAHPPLGGRFSGTAETALAPAAFMGADIGGIRAGAERRYADPGPAGTLAAALHAAEQDGYTEVFTGIYSSLLAGTLPLWIQLMHETVCKGGAGQAVYGDEGPEFQHHTNQRLFGGRENVFPVFVDVAERSAATLAVPDDLSDVALRERTLGDLDGQDLAASLAAEQHGVMEALDDADRPYAVVTVPEVAPGPVGGLVAFMQQAAVASAELRGVDPYGQPDVERSKAAGFRERFR